MTVCVLDCHRDPLDVEEQLPIVLPICCKQIAVIASMSLPNDGASPPGSDGRATLLLSFFSVLMFP
jgi:hypothetical protein